MDCEGKVVLVTGGVSGFGLALVKRFSGDGAKIAVLDINPDGSKILEEAIEGSFQFVQCDVTDVKVVRDSVTRVVDHYGKIDILINNAGILFSAPLLKFADGKFQAHDADDWSRVITTNLSSVFYVASTVAERMAQARTKGLIINVSSISANGNPGQSAYSAAKSGVNALTATWARELGVLGIRVAAIAPGFFDTDSTRQAVGDSVLKEVKKRIPLRRLGDTTELVDGVCWIVKNDFFNGKVLELDGGHVVSI